MLCALHCGRIVCINSTSTTFGLSSLSKLLVSVWTHLRFDHSNQTWCWWSLVSSASVSARGRVFVWRAGRRPCGTASPTHCWPPPPPDAPPPSRGSSPAAALSTTAWSGEKHTCSRESSCSEVSFSLRVIRDSRLYVHDALQTGAAHSWFTLMETNRVKTCL